jgi:hypothetical protein
MCEICQNWARVEDPYKIRTRKGVPLLTNHHENCPHYNDSLIDVWKMTVNGVSAYTDNAQDIEDWKQDEFEDETTVTEIKMHREIFENLPEFEGF